MCQRCQKSWNVIARNGCLKLSGIRFDPLQEHRAVEARLLANLGLEVLVPLDRSSDLGRKERREQREADRVANGIAPSIEVDLVVQELECEERKPDWKGQVDDRRRPVEAQEVRQRVSAVVEPAKVLEDAERKDVERHREHEEAPAPRDRVALDPADRVVDEREGEDQQQERRVPRSIEVVARSHQQRGPEPNGARPVEGNHGRQEQHVLRRVEKHAKPPAFGRSSRRVSSSYVAVR